jgi:hypothetical protein
MKLALLIFLFPVLCFAQHPLSTGAGIEWTRATSTPWNGTPEGLGGMTLHWVYTNATASPPAVISTWTDLIQAKVLTWNQAANQPIGTTTGVLFKANTGAIDALTNKFNDLWTLGNIGGSTAGDGTNLSMFAVVRQINNNFGSGEMPMLGGFGGGTIARVENSGAGTAFILTGWGGHSVTFSGSMNQIPVDFYLTVSNGVLWVWTNGIAAVTAQSWSVSGTPWFGLQLGCEPAMSPWHGNIAEVGFYTNKFFVDSGSGSATTINVSNIHYYVTNVARIVGISP